MYSPRCKCGRQFLGLGSFVLLSNGLFKEWQSVGPRPQLSHDSDYPMLLSVQCFAQLPIRFRKLVT